MATGNHSEDEGTLRPPIVDRGGLTSDATAPFAVLLYHSVSSDRDERFTVSESVFREHVALLAAQGRPAHTMSSVASALRERRALPERSIAVTFDDGYADTLPAVEMLAGHGISATVFVQTGRIGAAGYLDVAGLRALDDLGPSVEIGDHTVTHTRLDEVPRDRVEAELRDSRSRLENLLGHRVVGFAYPHGMHNRASRAAVVSQGFAYAAAVKNALSHERDDPFAIARWTVEHGVDAGRLGEVLDGVRVPVSWQGERIRTRAYRLVRRTRRQLAAGSR